MPSRQGMHDHGVLLELAQIGLQEPVALNIYFVALAVLGIPLILYTRHVDRIGFRHDRRQVIAQLVLHAVLIQDGQDIHPHLQLGRRNKNLPHGAVVGEHG